MSQPPRIGPPIGPSSIGIPPTATRRPSRFGPASRVITAKLSGTSMPPPAPCTIRNMMSSSIVGAIAHSSEPSVKMRTEVMKSRLLPNRSAAHPVIGITVANASM